MKPEQYDESVMALKRANKATAPYFWWFCVKDEEGDAALLVSKKEGALRGAAKAARKAAQDKKFAAGRLLPRPDGALGFGLDTGTVKTKQMQRALITQLAKADGFKRVKGLLVRAVVMTPEEFAPLANAADGDEGAGDAAPSPKRLHKKLGDARNRAKVAFGEARAAGASEKDLAGFKQMKEAGDELAKRAQELMDAPDADGAELVALLQSAADAFEEMADACRVAASTSDDSEGAAPVPDVDLAALNRTWLDAFDTVQGQLNSLSTALRKTGDEDLMEIAELGLSKLAEGRRVKFQAALLNAQRVKPEVLPEALAALGDAADDFKDWLDKSEEVAVCDDNPFGVTCAIRATLGGALSTIAAAV